MKDQFKARSGSVRVGGGGGFRVGSGSVQALFRNNKEPSQDQLRL